MKIFGSILDENKETLPGANVTLKNTPNIGTITDMNGNFILDNPVIGALSKVKVSYMGYEPVILSAGELQGKSIPLKLSNEQLSEVIIPMRKKQTKNIITQHLLKYKKPYILASSIAMMGLSFFIIKKNI